MIDLDKIEKKVVILLCKIYCIFSYYIIIVIMIYLRNIDVCLYVEDFYEFGFLC